MRLAAVEWARQKSGYRLTSQHLVGRFQFPVVSGYLCDQKQAERENDTYSAVRRSHRRSVRNLRSGLRNGDERCYADNPETRTKPRRNQPKP